MNLVLLGPPGVGKGTQAERIRDYYHIPHISTGDMFREAIRMQTELGQKAQGYMKEGKLVPDDIVIGIVRERLVQSDCMDGFLLDGFPRTIPQAIALDEVLSSLSRKIDRVINLTAEDKILLARITGRRVCKACNMVYHIENKPSQNPGVCDVCRGEVYQREDDREETVKKRLQVYTEQTAPLIEYYRSKGILLDVDGTMDIERVFQEIRQNIKEQGK